MSDATAAPRYLLVDGHSVIHAWPELRKLHLTGKRRHLAREQLMHRLRTVQDVLGDRVVVVFDGSKTVTNEERETDGLQIIYADTATTADTVLERLAARYAATFSMRVASADGMVRETIHALGADWLSPEGLRSICDDADLRLEEQLNRRRR